MDLDTVIKNRKSVRSFKSKIPDWRDILHAIDAASEAPFAGNHNNLRFLIIENTDTIKKISELAEQIWITESKILIVVCSDDKVLEDLYGERGRVYSRQQAGAAIENFLLKITDLGLAACWVGAYSDEKVRQLLKIPKHIQIEAIIPIGYESTTLKSKPRKKALENAIYWEEWDKDKRPTSFKEPSIRPQTGHFRE